MMYGPFRGNLTKSLASLPPNTTKHLHQASELDLGNFSGIMATYQTPNPWTSNSPTKKMKFFNSQRTAGAPSNIFSPAPEAMPDIRTQTMESINEASFNPNFKSSKNLTGNHHMK